MILILGRGRERRENPSFCIWLILLIYITYLLLYKIATRYLIPELAGTRLTPRICNRVADAFVSKYGKYAGWAQTLLFISELPTQKAMLPSTFWDTAERSSVEVQVKIQTIQETKEIIIPHNKRKRTGK